MMRRTILLSLFLSALFVLAGASAAQAAGGDHRAGLVVRFADGSVETRCVAFSEPSITGAELLTRSGLQIIMDYNSGSGGAVCSIAGAGCAFPTQDCFCRCQSLTCEYWAYYHWAGGWQYSQVGAGSYGVTDGALEGWSWGPGNWSSGTEPPAKSFDEVCPPPVTATPTATLAPTATPSVTPSPTPTTVQRPLSPPQVTFSADRTDLAPSVCTVLRWVTSDAEQVTLDGELVAPAGQRDVCPSATRRYVLVSANGAGQTAHEVIITVLNAEDAPPPPALVTSAAPAQTATPRPSLSPTVQSAIREQPTTIPPTLTPSPAPLVAPQPDQSAQSSLGAIPVAHAQELAAAPPTSSATAPVRLDPGIPVPTLLAQPTSTPRPRRILGADGRPTPTPILLAQIPPANGARPVTAALARTTGRDVSSMAAASGAPDRTFSLALLPGYAAYLLIAACLAAAGAWVVRRNGYR